ncbi:MAG: LuxR family transcriptional regulator [Gammaproteobacteria bacterium]|nr:MAG: LuxR family transcriptional regulator [Gammaproteobacteria bacterium]
MRSPLVDTDSFLAKLSEAGTAEECNLLLSSILPFLGIKRVGYVRINPPYSNKRSYVFTNWDKEWVGRYIERDYVYYDPMMGKARRSVTPFYWGSYSRLEISHPRQKSVMADASDFGHKCGIAVPIRDSHASLSVVSYIIDEKNEKNICESPSMMRSCKETLLLISLYYHAESLKKSSNLHEDASPPVLSSRQVEVLKWLAAGKTVWEASVILGIAEESVRYHLREAGRKLGTYGVTATVARSVADGYVSLG